MGSDDSILIVVTVKTSCSFFCWFYTTNTLVATVHQVLKIFMEICCHFGPLLSLQPLLSRNRTRISTQDPNQLLPKSESCFLPKPSV